MDKDAREQLKREYESTPGNRIDAIRRQSQRERLEETHRHTYIRYGYPPPDGNSRNWHTGAQKAGLSVFTAYEKDGKYTVDPGEDLYGAIEFLFLSYATGAPIYEADGKRVGTGDAGEPLLKPCILTEISHDDIEGCTWTYPLAWRFKAQTMASLRGGFLQSKAFAVPPHRRFTNIIKGR
jgi:hypothetical protein